MNWTTCTPLRGILLSFLLSWEVYCALCFLSCCASNHVFLWSLESPATSVRRAWTAGDTWIAEDSPMDPLRIFDALDARSLENLFCPDTCSQELPKGTSGHCHGLPEDRIRLVRVEEQNGRRVLDSDGCFSKRYCHHMLSGAWCKYHPPDMPKTGPFCSLTPYGFAMDAALALLFALVDHISHGQTIDKLDAEFFSFLLPTWESPLSFCLAFWPTVSGRGVSTTIVVSTNHQPSNSQGCPHLFSRMELDQIT